MRTGENYQDYLETVDYAIRTYIRAEQRRRQVHSRSDMLWQDKCDEESLSEISCPAMYSDVARCISVVSWQERQSRIRDIHTAIYNGLGGLQIGLANYILQVIPMGTWLEIKEEGAYLGHYYCRCQHELILVFEGEPLPNLTPGEA